MPIAATAPKRALTPVLPWLAAGTIVALVAAGCTKGSDRSSATSVSSATRATTASAAAQGDAARGKTIYATRCANCHGLTGTDGAAGPALANEKRRKTYAQTVAWIKDPMSPMPKLYPDTIGAKDVADVAAYVQTL